MGDIIEKLPIRDSDCSVQEDELSIAIFGEHTPEKRVYTYHILLVIVYVILSSPMLIGMLPKKMENENIKWIVGCLIFSLSVYFLWYKKLLQ